MGNSFTDAMEKTVAWKLTENGLDALNTTFDANLDLFATIGALRKRSNSDIEQKVAKAYCENALTCMKILFYARDINEGLGERNVFRVGLSYLAKTRPEDVRVNLGNIAKYGRFDDLYCLVGTPVENDMWDVVRAQWNADIEAVENKAPVSLLAKWLKSVNTSSAESNELGRKTAKALGLSEKVYRKNLAVLRKIIQVLEVKMSRNAWNEIDFTTVPGGAMKKYTKAFYRHEEERFKEYIEAVNTNKTITVVKKDGTVVEKEAKINTKKLFPYEILEKYAGGYFGLHLYDYKPECEAMWKGLDDYIKGVESNTIVIADTSGSMSGRPMATSVGLGIYFAERNQGAFHNKFMTFSSKPSWIDLKDGMTLQEKVKQVPNIVDNTNLEAAFDLILNTGKAYNVPESDMPKQLVIITDMEFDSCVCDNSCTNNGWYSSANLNTANMSTFYEKMKVKYESFGYKMPEIVFWHVDARQDTFHTTKNVPYVRLVSGQSPSVFKSLIDGKKHTPYEFMLEVVYADRYDSIVVSK